MDWFDKICAGAADSALNGPLGEVLKDALTRSGASSKTPAAGGAAQGATGEKLSAEEREALIFDVSLFGLLGKMAEAMGGMPPMQHAVLALVQKVVLRMSEDEARLMNGIMESSRDSRHSFDELCAQFTQSCRNPKDGKRLFNHLITVAIGDGLVDDAEQMILAQAARHLEIDQASYAAAGKIGAGFLANTAKRAPKLLGPMLAKYEHMRGEFEVMEAALGQTAEEKPRRPAEQVAATDEALTESDAPSSESVAATDEAELSEPLPGSTEDVRAAFREVHEMLGEETGHTGTAAEDTSWLPMTQLLAKPKRRQVSQLGPISEEGPQPAQPGMTEAGVSENQETETAETGLAELFARIPKPRQPSSPLVAGKGNGGDVNHTSDIFAPAGKSAGRGGLFGQIPGQRKPSLRQPEASAPVAVRKHEGPVSISEFHEEITRAARAFLTEGRVFVAPDIPRNVDANARKSCALCEEDALLALIDLTTVGSGKDCIAFCGSGIYFRLFHQWRQLQGELSFEALPERIEPTEIPDRPGVSIRVGNDCTLCTGQSDVPPEKLIGLLNHLREFVRHNGLAR